MRCRTSQFSYDSKRKVLTAEASDFGPLREGFFPDKLTKLYPDAADVGLFITSDRTGITIRYYLARTEIDMDENEILNWIFRPISEDTKQYPNAVNTRVIVFND